MEQKLTRNPNLTGFYPELKERVLKLKEIGISVNKFANTYCATSRHDAILKWATKEDRPLNHNLVPIVEEGIQQVKELILNV